MAKSNLWTLLLVLIPAFVACTKDGNTIYQTDPDEEKPSTAPLVTVIYGPNNYTNFGNLYTTSPKDFFVKR